MKLYGVASVWGDCGAQSSDMDILGWRWLIERPLEAESTDLQCARSATK